MADDDWVRVAFGATGTRDKDDVALVRRQTHDQVIEDLGDARTGPVTWRQLTAPAGVDLLLENGYGDDAAYAQLIKYLRDNPGGWLVIASAPANRAVPPSGPTIPAASA